jgi:putative Mn2+ efflux pump MntP
VSRQGAWSVARTLGVTFVAGLAHVLSTVLLGLFLAAAGGTLAARAEDFTHWVAPALLVILGLYFLYRHYYHHHFHLHGEKFGWSLTLSLAAAMFFSPCLEIEGFFLAAGEFGWRFTGLLALTYGTVTIAGMLIWMRLALAGLKRLDWHAWEHSAGLVTGFTLIVSGVLLYLFH